MKLSTDGLRVAGWALQTQSSTPELQTKSGEIAHALSLPLDQVQRAIAELQESGFDAGGRTASNRLVGELVKQSPVRQADVYGSAVRSFKGLTKELEPDARGLDHEQHIYNGYRTFTNDEIRQDKDAVGRMYKAREVLRDTFYSAFTPPAE